MAGSSIDESAEVIAREIGLDLSYLTSEKELHFDPFTVTVGAALILLGWFLEGVTGSLHKRVTSAGEALADRLTDSLTELFSNGRAPTEGDVRATARATAEAAQDSPDADVARVVDLNEDELVDYLIAQGMPRTPAARIARRVRQEAMRQADQIGDSGNQLA